MDWLLQRIGGPQVVIFTGVILTAIGGLWAAYKIQAKDEEITHLTQEVLAQTKEALAHATGGDSFCYITAHSDGKQIIFRLSHEGKYTLFNLKARLFPSGGGPTVVYETFPEWPPNQQANVAAIPVPEGDHLKYDGFFISRGRMWQQTLDLRRIAGRWEWKVEVQKDEPWEQKSQGYPAAHNLQDRQRKQVE